MGTLKIVTFNLRTNTEHDKINMFDIRRGMVLAKIDEEQPDIIGFQEMKWDMRAFLVRHLPDYLIVGSPRSADERDERVDIAIRRDVCELRQLESFRLSPTPEIPGSRYPDQSTCPRITTQVMLKHRDFESPIRVYNTHLDHVGSEARLLGMRQILAKIKSDSEKLDAPFFITGDFNATPGEPPVVETLRDGIPPVTDLTAALTETFHNWGQVKNEKIDYIFADSRIARGDNFKVSRWTDEKFGVYLSDHYPVEAEIEF